MPRPRPGLIYLTYGENILESGILFTQVRGMLLELAADSGDPIKLVSFVSPRLWNRRRAGFDELKRFLDANGIEFKLHLSYVAQIWGWWTLPFILLPSLPTMIAEILGSGCRVIHARGYGAALIALVAGKLTGRWSIFDQRGNYPDEMLLNGVWPRSSLSFRVWKRLEGFLAHHCSASVGVNPTMCKGLKVMGSPKVAYVPSRIGRHFFGTPIVVRPKKERPTLVFTGELFSSWYSPDRLAAAYLMMRRYVPNLRLKLLTRREKDWVKAQLIGHGLNESDFEITSGSPDEVPGLIAECDMALQMGLGPQAYWPAWPVKTGEYFAMGLPVALEDNLGPPLTKIVPRWKLGFVYDLTSPESFAPAVELMRNRADYAERCRHYARVKLPISHSASQYSRLYRQLADG